MTGMINPKTNGIVKIQPIRRASRFVIRKKNVWWNWYNIPIPIGKIEKNIFNIKYPINPRYFLFCEISWEITPSDFENIFTIRSIIIKTHVSLIRIIPGILTRIIPHTNPETSEIQKSGIINCFLSFWVFRSGMSPHILIPRFQTWYVVLANCTGIHNRIRELTESADETQGIIIPINDAMSATRNILNSSMKIFCWGYFFDYLYLLISSRVFNASSLGVPFFG